MKTKVLFNTMVKLFAFSIILDPNQKVLAENSGKHSFADGVTAYQEQDYNRAATAFQNAASSFSNNVPLKTRAAYNQGNSLLQLKDWAKADTAFEDAQTSEDLEIQERVTFNRGYSAAQQALELEQQQDLKPAVEKIKEALAAFKNTLELNPSDHASKINYELSQRKLQKLEEEQEEQQEQNQEQEQEQDQEEKEDQSNQSNPSDQEKEDQTDQQDQSSPTDQEEEKQEGQPNSPKQNNQPEDSSEEDPKEGQQNNSPPPPAENMTEEEATALLDAMLKEEEASREQKQRLKINSIPVLKDW